MKLRASLMPGYRKIKPGKEDSFNLCLRVSQILDGQIPGGYSDSQGAAQLLPSLASIRENNGCSSTCIWGLF